MPVATEPEQKAAAPLQEPSPGRYRHYKGRDYEVLGTATHSETGERLVVYRACYGEHGLWVRPLTMFIGTVVVDGVLQRRFSLHDDCQSR